MQPFSIPIQNIQNNFCVWLSIFICLLLLFYVRCQNYRAISHLGTQIINSDSLLIFFNPFCSLTNTRQSWPSWPGRGWGVWRQERLGFLSTLSSGVLQTSAFPALHSQVPVEISLLNHHKGAVRDSVIWTWSINTKYPAMWNKRQ